MFDDDVYDCAVVVWAKSKQNKVLSILSWGKALYFSYLSWGSPASSLSYELKE